MAPPVFWAMNIFAAPFVNRNMLVRFVFSTALNSSAVVSKSVLLSCHPALFTTMSSFPYVRAAVSKAACTSASFPTSHRQNAASPPSLTMAFATSCPLASSLSAKTIRAPSAAKRRAAAAPMPLAAPVMMAVFPCSFMALSLFVAVSGKFFPYTRSDIPDKRGSKTKIRRKAPTAWPPVPSTGGRGVSAPALPEHLLQ